MQSPNHLPFQEAKFGSSPLASLCLATRGVMEILGLDPYQSQTQYLEEKHREPGNRKLTGNKFPLRFRFISACYRFQD